MNDNQNVERMKNVPPFVKFVCANVPMVFDDSLSYYEALCALWKYVQDCVDVINNNATLEEEYIAKFEDLKTFVDTYFENLDVQEEINNKLDEMAEDGTLDSIIGEYIVNGTGQVKYIFPKTTQYTSEYSIIQGYGKNIMIDCGRSEEYTELTDTLAAYGIEHIDYMIISHFHVDHCGNLIQLYTDGYCDTTTTLILPNYDTTVWNTDSSYAQYTAIMTYLTTNSIPYINPTEGYHVDINDVLGFSIYNTDDTYYVDHNINSQYNNASLITLVTHFGQQALYVGDCYKHALQKIYNDGVIPETIHLYKAGHHGIDRSAISIIEVIRNLNIVSAVYVVGMLDVAKGKCCKGGTGVDLDGQVDNIYISAYNRNNIQFSSYINSMNLVKGFNESGLDNLNYANETIYVDVENAGDFQNGTQDYPFKSLNQALGFLQRDNGRNYTVNVAAGTYQTLYDNVYARPRLYGCTNKISIVGAGNDTILNYGFDIVNCANINISNLKIVNMLDAKIINIEASNATFDNISIENDVSVGKKYGFGITNNSHVVITNTTIKSCSYGINEYNSDVELKGITFTDISSQCLYGRNGNFIRSDDITITDASVSHGRYDVNEKPIFTKGLTLWSGTHVSTDGSITGLFARPTRFQKIDVEYTFASHKYVATFDITGTSQNARICGSNITNTNINFYDEALALADSYTVAINTSKTATILASDSSTTITSGASITITKIIAH